MTEHDSPEAPVGAEQASVRALARDASRSARPQLRLLVAASAAQGLAVLALPHCLGRAVDTVLVDTVLVDTVLAAAPAGGPGPLTWVQATVAVVVVAVVAEALVVYAGGAANARASAAVRTRLVAHSLAAGPALTRAMAPGDLLTRGTGNAGAAGSRTTNAVAIWTAALPALGALVLLFRIDWRLGAAFLVGLVLLAAAMSLLVRRASDVTEHYQAAQGRIAAGLTEAVAGARTIAAAGTAPAEARRVLTPLPWLRHHGYAIWRAQAAGMAQAAVLVPALEIVVLAVAGWRLTQGHLSVGQLVSAGGYVMLATELVTALGAAVGFAQARSAAARCAAVLDIPTTAYGTAGLPAGRGDVDVADVWVGDGPAAALRGVTVLLAGGTTVAVVGPSGSGKSTFAALFGRLVEPDRGTVWLDGVPLADLHPGVLHRAVTYAFARPALLGRTVADTVALGADLAGPEAVRAAARDACAAAFVERLPDGYSTPLAEVPLSGGEAQRLGLARAFAHPGRVLVLDDATSSLDTVTERQVSTAIAERSGAATRVVVAHRASTAARADVVLWLDAGAVRGYAPHRELWAEPAYRAVFAADQPGRLATVTLLPVGRRPGGTP